MAYKIVSPTLGGWQPIGASDTVANHALGTVVTAQDPVFGQGEFIYLLGVASTVTGSLVTYDGTTYATTLSATTANQGRPVAWAMNANVASNYGWYQISGTVVALKTTANKFLATVALGVISTGKVGSVSSGKQILGARTANLTTVTSATTTVNVVVNRPHLQGRVT